MSGGMIMLNRLAVSAMLTIAAFIRAAGADEAESANPYDKYVKKVEVDKFNPGPAGKTLLPQRGGTMTIRVPTDPESMNVLNSRGAQSAEIQALMSSSFITRDLETFEYLPLMAWKFEIRDQLTLADGSVLEGVVLEQDETSVTFAPDAGRITIGKNDLKNYDLEKGVAVTIQDEELQGAVSQRDYTVTIVPTARTHSVREIAVAEIGSWTDQIGDKERVRPAIKPQVIYYYHLRDKLSWNDGQPVTIDDFLLGLNTINNPHVDCAQLRNYLIDIEKQEQIDERTIKYTCRKPYFQALAITGSIDPLPAHVLHPEKYVGDEQGYAEFFNTHPMYRPSDAPGGGKMIMCGPYKLKHWLKGQELTIERNPHFWTQHYNIPYAPKEQPYLDQITWTVINSTTAALKELQKGTVDVDFDVEPQDWVRLDTQTPEFTRNLIRAKSITPLFTYIAWNEKRELFQSKKVRQALTMLLPLDKMLQDIHFGQGRMISGPFFIDGPAYDHSIKPWPYDPQAAKRLLRQEGWIDRDGDGVLDKDGRKFEFEYMIHTAREYHAKIADIVKENIEQAGIKVLIRKLDWTVFGDLVNDRQFDAVRFAWGAVTDPDPFQIWHSSQADNRGSNYISYSNPRVDEICEAVREEFDPLKRWEMLREMHRILHEDQPYTFNFCFDALQFYNKKFRNVKFYSTSSYGHDLSEWCAVYAWR